MGNRIWVSGLTAGLVICLVGCGKKEEETSGRPLEPEMERMMQDMAKQEDAAKKALADAKTQADKKLAEATKAAEQTKADAEKQLAEASKAADAAAADAKAQVGAMQKQVEAIAADAKALVGEKNYQQALAKLQQGMQLDNLTAEQKGMLQALIDSVKKSMAQDVGGEAKKKLGGFLNKLGK